MKLSFHGAASDVTGSCHLVETGGHRILVDCGLFQGSRELQEDNSAPLGFEPASLDCVLLTHAHLDHCGRLPLLVKRGFRGRIVATKATCELARLVMMDAAHLHEEDNRRHTQGALRRGANEAQPPLYTVVDALDTIGRFGAPADYGKPVEIGPGLRATFFNAGHILGSASVLVEFDESQGHRTVLFSGDIGSPSRPLLLPPEPPAAAEVVVMETTYGDRPHRQFAASCTELYDAINAGLARGGNILIPTFALERAQELLYFLRQGIEIGKLPSALPVYLDSPMAISASEIFERHPDSFLPEVRALFDRGEDPFKVPGLRLTRERADSMAINRVSGGAVIMAGSGMCTGGRIRHHLRHNLWRPEASVVFVGYAAAGTPARRIIDGAKQVEFFGERIPVRARIHTINGFSAHADQAGLLAWQDRIGGKRAIFLVHGEAPAMKSFAALLKAPRIETPRIHQQFEL